MATKQRSDIESAEEQLAHQVSRFVDELKATDAPGSKYEPFIPAVRSRSRGYLQRVPGDGCSYDFLSRPEFYAFLPFDHERELYPVIRPQFRIPSELTWAVSRVLKLFNPYSEKYPASVDFIVTKRGGGWIAVDFKPEKELQKPNVQRKLHLVTETLKFIPDMERLVLSETDLHQQLTRNLRFIRLYALPFDPPPASEAERNLAEPVLFALLQNGTRNIYDAAREAAVLTGIEAPRAVRTCLWLVANRIWSANLRLPIGPDYPLMNLQRQ